MFWQRSCSNAKDGSPGVGSRLLIQAEWRALNLLIRRAAATPAARQTAFMAQEGGGGGEAAKGIITSVAAMTMPIMAWKATE